MKEHNLDDLLKQLDPARGVALPEPDELAPARIRAQAARARTRGRRRIVGAIAATALVGGGTAAAFFLRSDTPTDPVAVVCYEAADLEARALDVAAPNGLRADLCGPLWQDGSLGDGGLVPPLTPCVLDGGGLGIFPGDATVCEKLGLALAVDLPSLDTVASLAQQLQAFTLSRPCPNVDATRDRALRVLEDLELSDWTVTASSARSPDRPCGTTSVVADERRVVVIAVPDLGG